MAEDIGPLFEYSTQVIGGVQTESVLYSTSSEYSQSSAEGNEKYMFNVFGQYDSLVYNALKSMRKPDGSYFMSFMSRGSNEMTNNELVIEVISLLLELTSSPEATEYVGDKIGTPVEGGLRLDYAFMFLVELVNMNVSIPWQLNTQAILAIKLKVSEKIRVASLKPKGRRVLTMCANKGCEGMEVQVTFRQLARGDEAIKEIILCTTCGRVRRGTQFDPDFR